MSKKDRSRKREHDGGSPEAPGARGLRGESGRMVTPVGWMGWGPFPLLAGATGLALFLGYLSWSGGAVPGCGPEGGCDEILKTRWGRWLGMPVGFLAALLYGGVGVAGWLSGQERVARRAVFHGVAVAGALGILAAAAWFVGLQALVLRRFCTLCCSTHALGVLGALLMLVRASRTSPAGAPLPWAVGLMGAAGLAVLMGVGQMFGGRVGPAVGAIDGGRTGLAAPGPRPPPVLRLHRDAFALPLEELPLLGSTRADHVMVSQFDYTCIHCREAHAPITKAQKHFSNQLAVVGLPLPLDAGCNPLIRRTPSAHTNACELARLALAVWRADRSKFPEFDDWLMQAARGGQIAEVRRRAEGLVGLMPLTQALSDPWIDATIAMSVRLYQSNALVLRNGKMPMMIIGTNIVSGTLKGPDELFGFLDRGFGLRRQGAP